LSEQVRAYSKHVGFEVDNAAEIDSDEAPFADPETGGVTPPHEAGFAGAPVEPLK
jgi:hypothetical protein